MIASTAGFNIMPRRWHRLGTAGLLPNDATRGGSRVNLSATPLMLDYAIGCCHSERNWKSAHRRCWLVTLLGERQISLKQRTSILATFKRRCIFDPSQFQCGVDSRTFSEDQVSLSKERG